MKKIVLSAMLFGSTLSMMAGGYLTNTNQSVTFLRNPAQDANINLNGVYSNPAGVNFLQPGFHFGINLQSAYQTREIESAFKPFEYGIRNNDSASKTFKAEAKAPVIPSLQGAWVNGPLSLQVNLALVGGGGKATYHNGLGSFESKVALLGAIGNANHALGFNRYDVDAYMHGRQYFYGLTLGAGYRIGEHFSVYGGVRGVLAAAHYDGYLRNIRINGGDRNGNQMTSAPEYLKQKSDEFASAAATNGKLALTAANAATQAAAAAQAASASGNITLAQSKSAEAKEQAQLAQSYNQKLGDYRKLAYTTGALAQATQDVSINVHQHAFGLAPIVGAHFHNSFLDVAAKYEFRTRIAFANESKNSATTAAAGEQFAAFADKTEVRSDIPALLTVGLRVRPVESLRLNLGYHYYFDKQAKSGVKNAYKNELLDHGTQEFLGARPRRLSLGVKHGRQQHVLEDAQAAQRRVPLRDQTDTLVTQARAFLIAHRVQVCFSQPNRARRGREHAGEHGQQRALAAARMPGDDGQLPRLQRKVERCHRSKDTAPLAGTGEILREGGRFNEHVTRLP